MYIKEIMESALRSSEDLHNQGLLNLVQVKQEADDEPHIVYNDNEQWAFLFKDVVNGMNDDAANSIDAVEPKSSYEPDDEMQPKSPYEPVDEIEPKSPCSPVNEIQPKSPCEPGGEINIKTELEPEIHRCHWCTFTTLKAIELIDHDYECHARYIQGRRIHKSYKCPSCEFTAVEPVIIRNHFEIHNNFSENADADANIVNVTKKKKTRKRKKKSWFTLEKQKREKRRMVAALQTAQVDETISQNDTVSQNETISEPFIQNETISEPFTQNDTIIVKKEVISDNEEEVSDNAETIRINKKRRKKISMDERRMRKKLHARRIRATMTPEAIALRRLNDAFRRRLKRSLETDEEKAERRRKQALHARQKRAKETPEQVELRRLTQRNRAKLRRSLETSEQRELRKERERLRAREKRATMTKEKKIIIKEIERKRKRYFRQAKVNSNDFMHATEFLTTTLAAPESSCDPSVNFLFGTYPQNIQNVENNIVNYYNMLNPLQLPLHMLEEQPLVETSRKSPRQSKKSSNKQARTKKSTGKKKKKKGRPSKKDKELLLQNIANNDQEGSTSEPPPTNDSTTSKFASEDLDSNDADNKDKVTESNHELEKFRNKQNINIITPNNESVNGINNETEESKPEKSDNNGNHPNESVNGHSRNKEIFQEEDSGVNQTKQEQETENTEVKEIGNKFDTPAVATSNHLSASKTIFANNMEGNSELVKDSVCSKMDKINKLLERMYGKSANGNCYNTSE